MKSNKYHLVFKPLSYLLLKQKYSINNRKKSQKRHFKKAFSVDADCGSVYWSSCSLTSPIHPFIYFPPFLTLSPFIIQLSVYFSPLFLPHFPSSSPHSSSLIFSCQNDYLSSVCVCVCARNFVTAQGKISVRPMVIGNGCLYYRLLLRDRETTNSESEWVCVCLCALSCLCSDMPASLWAQQCAYLRIFFCLSVILWGQFAVWGLPQWWGVVGRRSR